MAAEAMRALRKLQISLWAAAGLAAIAFGAAYVTYGPGTGRMAVVQERPSAGMPISRPFALTDQRGQPFTERDLLGRPHLVFFGFTHCPDVCPTTLAELTDLLSELGPEADKLSTLLISVDPERDTQELLAQYLTAFDPRIRALRGTPEQTQAALKAFAAFGRKVPLEGGDYMVEHTAGVLMIDDKGKLMGLLDMHEPKEAKLAKLRRLTTATS
jgi:protein SCO1